MILSKTGLIFMHKTVIEHTDLYIGTHRFNIYVFQEVLTRKIGLI